MMLTLVSTPAVLEISAPFERSEMLLSGRTGPRTPLGPFGPRSNVPRLKSTVCSEWLMTCFMPTLLARQSRDGLGGPAQCHRQSQTGDAHGWREENSH
jgi:hypothetical protein